MKRLFGRSPPPHRFAPLEIGHAEACAALHAAAFAQGWSSLDFERLIAARSSWSDAVLDGRTGALVGFVLARGGAGEAEILTVTIAQAWRGRGLGAGLLLLHMERIARHGILDLFLEVAEDNASARRLYAKLGFVEAGRRPAYYRSQGAREPVAALVLRRALG